MNTYQFDFPTNNNYSFIHLANGNYYKLHILYDTLTDSYYMNIDKYIDNKFVNIINSVKLVVGMNLLLQYDYFDIGQIYVIPISDTLYDKDPSAGTIKNGYFILWEHD